MTIHHFSNTRLAAPVSLLVLMLLAACTPVVTLPPELPTFSPEPLVVVPTAPQAISCDQLAVSLQGSACQEAQVVITLDLGQPLADLGLLQVNADGSLLACSPVSGAPNLVQCSGVGLAPEKLVVLTLCPGGCAPSAGCPAATYFDAAFQACLPIPGGTGQPSCPPAYQWDAASATCQPDSSSWSGSAGKPLAVLGSLLTVANCPAGEYPDSGSCLSCPAGYICDGVGQPVICPAGTFSGAGSSACSPCPAGSYNGNVGQSSCLACPPGTSAQAGGVECYTLATPAPACPDGFVFDGSYLTCLPLNGPTSPTCTTLVVRLPGCP